MDGMSGSVNVTNAWHEYQHSRSGCFQLPWMHRNPLSGTQEAHCTWGYCFQEQICWVQDPANCPSTAGHVFDAAGSPLEHMYNGAAATLKYRDCATTRLGAVVAVGTPKLDGDFNIYDTRLVPPPPPPLLPDAGTAPEVWRQLRAAIETCNTQGSATISLVGGSVLDVQAHELELPLPDLSNCNLIVRKVGPGANPRIIGPSQNYVSGLYPDGANTRRRLSGASTGLFRLTAGSKLEMSHVDVSNFDYIRMTPSALSADGFDIGGGAAVGVMDAASSAYIIGGVFSELSANNERHSGGAFFNRGTMMLRYVTVSKSWAQNFGGCIGNEGSLTVADSHFFRCSAMNGGAISSNGGSTTLTRSTFTSCTSIRTRDYRRDSVTETVRVPENEGGGAFFWNGADADITGCTFTSCVSYGDGGSISVRNDETGVIGIAADVNRGQSLLTITDTTIASSSADDDGGSILLAGDAVMTATGLTITDSRANQTGGAIRIGVGAQATLTDAAISGATVLEGDGGAINNDGSLTVVSSSLVATAKRYGGCLANKGVATLSAGTTLAGCSAGTGGGALYVDGSLASTSFHSSTVSGATSGSTGDTILLRGGGRVALALSEVTQACRGAGFATEPAAVQVTTPDSVTMVNSSIDVCDSTPVFSGLGAPSPGCAPGAQCSICNAALFHVAAIDGMRCVCKDGYYPEGETFVDGTAPTCLPCPNGQFSRAGSTTCSTCGMYDIPSRTATTTDVTAPFGIKCQGGVLYGALPGHYTAVTVSAANFDVVRAWDCSNNPKSLLGRVCHGGLDGYECDSNHTGTMCATCIPGSVPVDGLCVPSSAEANNSHLIAAYFGILCAWYLGGLLISLAWLCWVRASTPKLVLPWQDPEMEERMLVLQTKSLVKATAGSKPSVWICAEAPRQTGDPKFSRKLTQRLSDLGVRVTLSEEIGDTLMPFDRAAMCIFVISDNLFADSRCIEAMRRCIELKKFAVVVVAPGSSWKGKPFPENAFNPECSPYLPDVKSIFAEIAITWEADHEPECTLELIRRLNAHLAPIQGSPIVDFPNVERLLELEAEKNDIAAQASPVGYTENIDWQSKQFDVFLSHKITDAKDVVLSWYNFLAASNVRVFLDRISLDAVDKIPMYVEQTSVFVVALSRNLFESYWCAVELCKAVDLHAEGLIQIVLVPVEGETWDGPNDGETLTFPTPDHVLKNYAKWFPDLASSTRENIVKLFGGGEYTVSRTLHHTRLHVKSFERLFRSKIGLCLNDREEIRKHVEAGGATLQEVAQTLVPLTAEANLLAPKGVEYAPVIERNSSLKRVTGLVVEQKINGKFVAKHTPNEFVEIVRMLRITRSDEKAAGELVSLSALVVEQWNTASYTRLDGEAIFTVITEIMTPISRFFSQIISFIQVQICITLSLFGFNWPLDVSILLNALGFLNIDFMALIEYQQFRNIVNYANLSVLAGFVLTVFILAIVSGLGIMLCIERCSRFQNPARRTALVDNTIKLLIVVLVVVYLPLSSRLMRTYKLRSFEGQSVLEEDWRVGADMGGYYAGISIWVAIYVVGIPVLFLYALLVTARAKAMDIHMANTPDALALEKRRLTQFGILFLKYKANRWWWELIEMVRKLFYAAVLIFVAAGTIGQVWCSILVALAALLMQVFFNPFLNSIMDLTQAICLLCTMLTLMAAVVLKMEQLSPSGIDTGAVGGAMLAFQIIPAATVFLAMAAIILKALRGYLANKKLLPAAMRDEEPVLAEESKTTSTKTSTPTKEEV